MDEAKKQAALTAARTLLAVVGSWVVAHGYSDDKTVQEVIGALLVLGPLAWEIVQRYRAANATVDREHAALNAGIALSNAEPDKPTAPVPKAEVSAVLDAAKEGRI